MASEGLSESIGNCAETSLKSRVRERKGSKERSRLGRATWAEIGNWRRYIVVLLFQYSITFRLRFCVADWHYTGGRYAVLWSGRVPGGRVSERLKRCTTILQNISQDSHDSRAAFSRLPDGREGRREGRRRERRQSLGRSRV